MKCSPVSFGVLACLSIASSPRTAIGQAQFEILEECAHAIVYDISEDGSVIVGSCGGVAIKWGGTGSGILTNSISEAFGVSGDGSVVVGYAEVGGDVKAVRWTDGGEMEILPESGTWDSRAYDVSIDGSVIVGWVESNGSPRACYWNALDQRIWLGVSGPGIEARAVSADGTMLAVQEGGYSLRWSETQGTAALGVLPGGGSTYARGISADGSTVVGYGTASNADPYEAFRWTSETGIVGLGDLPGAVFRSEAYGVSGDGSIIVGRSWGSPSQTAFVWDPVNGMRNLKVVLVKNYGLNIPMDFDEARAISSDGLHIAGREGTAIGTSRPWVVHLPCPPKLAGDIDIDCNVDLVDFATFAMCFGLSSPNPGCDATEIFRADIDGTDVVDLGDFAAFALNFGN